MNFRDQEQHSDARGRGVRVQVYGDTAEELEMAALDEARQVFGKDRRLQIERSYRINPANGALKEKAAGKRYVTTMLVLAVG